jgi:hypothetical protein
LSEGGLSGYASGAYAESLAEWGRPRRLPGCGGWILERLIPGSTSRDAMGCYPLFACRDWTLLHDDFAELEGELVSVVMVADPFGNHDQTILRRCFGDLVAPFKEHFTIDLGRAPESFVDAHHRRNARKALGQLSVEVCADAAASAREWCELYAALIKRHNIRGLTAFSDASLTRQLSVPGMVMLRASHEGRTVGMTLWYVEGAGVGYYHLGAYSEEGYKLRASFALFWRAIEHFAGAGLRWLDLGAGAGLGGVDPQADGLSRFKRGWSTGTRTAYLCGRIFDRRRYDALALGVSPATRYFPAYRAGEFG